MAHDQHVFSMKGVGPLSTHALTPFVVAEHTYSTVEHYYNAQKTDSSSVAELIRNAKTLHRAKKLATQHLSPQWNEQRSFDAMTVALRAKYGQHPRLAAALLDTFPKRLVCKEAKTPTSLGTGFRFSLGDIFETIRDELTNTPGYHPFLESRIVPFLRIMQGIHQAGSSLSSASKGTERELFVGSFLSQFLPPAYRLSSGDITDAFRQHTGQVDVIIETPLMYSFPLLPNGPRLHLAEGVAVALEIKSNAKTQWEEVKATAAKLKKLRRRYQAHLKIDSLEMEIISDRMEKRDTAEKERHLSELKSGVTTQPYDAIPLVAVGFQGWKSPRKIKDALDATPDVDAIFVAEHEYFVQRPPTPGAVFKSGKGAWSLIACLDFISAQLQKTVSIVPSGFNYYAG